MDDYGPLPWSEEEIWAMPMEEIMALDYEAVQGRGWIEEGKRLASEAAAAIADSRRPGRGTGLLAGVANEGEPALAEVAVERGEHLVVNEVRLYGVCELRFMRLGRPPGAEFYLAQVQSQFDGASSALSRWQERKNGQELHFLAIVWQPR